MTRDERLAEIAGRYHRGTKGTWYWEATGPATVKIWAECESGDELVCDKIYTGDAEIITEARPDVTFLLLEIRRLDAVIAGLQLANKKFHDSAVKTLEKSCSDS